jgi:hypothetical protein
MTFLAGNGLRNKLLKYWHEVLKHPACKTSQAFIHAFILGSKLDQKFHTSMSLDETSLMRNR